MNSLLFGIALSAILSIASLVIVLLRVSPLTAPNQAIPAFFLSLFLAISTVATLGFVALWKYVPHHTWDTGKLMGIAMRQGAFVGAATIIVLQFHILELLTWWIALMIFAVFLLIELALEH